ncbi:HD domain-containing protein [Rhizobium laguerreae]|uniref:HD domain-containing protein n=2 Tax=Rhizobium laguerreae TaxID=1076926 RepID=A0AAJ2ZZT3_9HYPH|nr:HD domain-containing protein [Rhizobium laguerreae]MBY3080306.1 HD domain-containing protein [Rhizobium laguerreae]MBY3086436.1 HD domain-containing protein [Rhizobium laguerreae]MBY3113571.1 HD domain-containing protein [Rhizobium laguerreae]MBY3145894.1 HD domain-containing protein [Rhizobium laguerreae]
MFAAEAFSPHETLAAALIAHAADGDDGSHDLAHILRVFRNAMRIHAEEGGDGRVLAASVLLHDCVAVEKNSPLRAKASALAAEKASEILAKLGWSVEDIDAAAHAITAHSFSAGVAPRTLEAKILQDADRLDAIGMVGAARCFYIAGRLGSGLYDPFDPPAADRPLDDKRYAIDHFQTKLFKLAEGFQTETGRRLAAARDKSLRDFLSAFMDEI